MVLNRRGLNHVGALLCELWLEADATDSGTEDIRLRWPVETYKRDDQQADKRAEHTALLASLSPSESTQVDLKRK